MDATDKILAKKKIQQLVFLHAQYVHNQCGVEVNQEREQKRLYNEWVAGLITLDEIQEDFIEYNQLLGR